jgi:hypothetical protein
MNYRLGWQESGSDLLLAGKKAALISYWRTGKRLCPSYWLDKRPTLSVDSRKTRL